LQGRHGRAVPRSLPLVLLKMPRLGLGSSQGQSALFDAEGNERTGIGHRCHEAKVAPLKPVVPLNRKSLNDYGDHPESF
jgi:hypothetical protein